MIEEPNFYINKKLIKILRVKTSKVFKCSLFIQLSLKSFPFLKVLRLAIHPLPQLLIYAAIPIQKQLRIIL